MFPYNQYKTVISLQLIQHRWKIGGCCARFKACIMTATLIFTRPLGNFSILKLRFGKLSVPSISQRIQNHLLLVFLMWFQDPLRFLGLPRARLADCAGNGRDLPLRSSFLSTIVEIWN